LGSTYQSLRPELELASDWLAGPLYKIEKAGECDYVFNDSRTFPGVTDADTFLRWCLDLVSEFRELALSVTVSNERDKADRTFLLRTADLRDELSRLAFEIVRQRKDGPSQSTGT